MGQESEGMRLVFRIAVVGWLALDCSPLPGVKAVRVWVSYGGDETSGCGCWKLDAGDTLEAVVGN